MVELTIFIVGSFLFKDNYFNKKVMFFSLSLKRQERIGNSMKVIVIVGPTGVGKTKLSIALAKKYDGEVINADAMQVYKKLNIGTAKVREEEKEGISHHLFDIKDVCEEYSIYHYQKDCREKIDEVIKRGHVPIIVGGTGLYLKSALYDYELSPSCFRDTSEYENKSVSELRDILTSIDPVGAKEIDFHNKRRLINAILYYQENGKSIVFNRTNKLLYDCIFIGLTTEREKLYEIINRRVDVMIENGLVDEAYSFYQQNIQSKPLLGGIGYKELYSYFDGEISLEEAISLIKRNSRRYAKRQYTFFRNQLDVKWFDTNYTNFSKTVGEVAEYLSKELEK